MKEKLLVSWPGWEAVRIIGRGSFGAVYEIQREVFGEVEKAALKVISIPPNGSDIDEMYSNGYDEESVTNTFQAHLKSIVSEYSLMRKMNGSHNVVHCDDIRYVQHDDGIGWDIFIKMELLTPLTKALPAQVPEETVIKIAKDLCNALVVCKEHNVIHRDIKPQNIFVSQYGDYKLGDFGIAKTVEKTMGGTKIGTYNYMAPEVYNNQPYGTASDIYSLGLVLYWMLNERRLPFMPLPPAKLGAGMEEESRLRRFSGEALLAPKNGSEKLKKIVLKACAFDSRERYSSAAEMLADLERMGTVNAQTELRMECEEESEIYQNLSDVDEDEKTREKWEEETRRAREQEEAENRRRKLEEREWTQKQQDEKNNKWAEKEDQQNRLRKRKQKAGLVCTAAAVLLAVLGLFLLTRSSGDELVLMSDPVDLKSHWDEEAERSVLDEEPMVLGSQIPRAKIRSITFLDTLNNAPDDSWDVSQNRDGSVLAWVLPAGELYNLYIAGNGSIRAPQDCQLLFAEYTAMESFKSNDFFDTSRVTNMSFMFLDCSSLTELNIGAWDTSQVGLMVSMFGSCSSLTELNIGDWDTSQVTDMSFMFSDCSSLTELNIGAWDTSRVKVMASMFGSCSSLTELNIGNWDTSQVTEVSSMFFYCSDLTELNIGGWDTSRVMNMAMMFSECSGLTELNIGNWDTSRVTNMEWMFQECYGLFTWDESHGCYVPGGLNIQNWNVDNVESFERFVYLDGKPVELYGQPWEDFFS